MSSPESGPGYQALVLASASPRRRELLGSVGIECEVVHADVSETLRSGVPAHVEAQRLALEKSRDVASRTSDRDVLGADTLVVAPSGAILGKPDHGDDARRMLCSLAGREHTVVTGVALITANGDVFTSFSETKVRFATLTEDEIDSYCRSAEPLDKAGAYAIQGAAAWFVTGVTGSVTNVIGLPLETVRWLFQRAGLSSPSLTCRSPTS